MIKPSKKKWKTTRVEVDNLQPADNSECVDQTKFNQTITNPCDGAKEKSSLKPKKMKSCTSKPRYICSRSKSVPIKTVSFWPYIVPSKAKVNTCRNNVSPRCRVKTGPRRSMQCRRRVGTERSYNHVEEPDSSMSCEHTCTGHERCIGEYASTGPSEYNNDALSYGIHHNPASCSISAKSLSCGQCSTCVDSIYRNQDTGIQYPRYSHGNSSGQRATYVSDIGTACSPWMSSMRPVLSSPALKKWGPDGKYDYLMAKYSEHNYPKTHPARADFFAFQRFASEDSKHNPNMSVNVSPNIRFRSLSQTRTSNVPTVPQYTHTSISLGSKYGNLDNSYSTGVTGPFYCASNNNKPVSYSQVGSFQSAAMRDLMYDSLSKKYINTSLGGINSRILNVKSDSEMNTLFHRCRSPRPVFPSINAECPITNHLCRNCVAGNKYDFSDDMKLMSRHFNMSGNALLKPGSRANSRFIPRSRSIDSSFLSSLTKYSDINESGKFCPSASGGMKSGLRQFDNCMNKYGMSDSWKNVHDKPDDVTLPSKYCYNCSRLKSSCSCNSDEKFSSHRLTSDSKLSANRSWNDENWSSNQLKSESFGYSKSAKNVLELDSYLAKLEESDSKRPWDKYTNRHTSSSSNSDQTSKVVKNNSNDCGFSSDITRDALNSVQRKGLSLSSTLGLVKDFTSLRNRRRDESLSPICQRDISSFSCSNVGSYLKGNDLSRDYKNTIPKHGTSDGLWTGDNTFDKFSIGSERKFSTYATPRETRMSYLKTGNLNFNQSQNNDSLRKCHTLSNSPVHASSWNFTSTDTSYPDRLDSCSKNCCNSCWLDSSKALSSLVDQETDRLNKVANAIELQQDSCQDSDDGKHC